MKIKYKKGLTLVELIIAGALVVLVIAAAWMIYNTSQRFFISTGRQSGVKDEAAFALEHMARNIRPGNGINVDVDGAWVEVSIDLADTADDFSDDTTIRYNLSGTDLIYDPNTKASGDDEPIAKNISSLNFTLTQNRLDIDITAEDDPETITLNSAVMLRSMPAE